MLKISIDEGKANVYAPYHPAFVTRIKKLGGAKWDGTEKCWTVNVEMIPHVREIMAAVYGETDEEAPAERVTIKLTAGSECYSWHSPVTAFGKILSSASGRDSGARIGDDVAYIKGNARSGGSAKNWYSVVSDGAEIMLYNVPKILWDRYLDKLAEGEEFDYTAELVETKIDVDALNAEKAKLLSRIAEIDVLLSTTSDKVA